MLPTELQSTLDTLLDDAPQGFVALDFDNTIIRGDLGETFLYHLYHTRQFRLSEDFSRAFQSRPSAEVLLNAVDAPPDPAHPFTKEYQAWQKNGQKVPPEHLLELCLKEYLKILENFGAQVAYPWSAVLFSGFRGAEFNRLAEEVITDLAYHVIRTEPVGDMRLEVGFRPLEVMRDFILAVKERGLQVAIVTASPQALIAEFFRLHPDYEIAPQDVIGMRHLRQGELMGIGIEPPMTYGPGKVEAFARSHGAGPIVFAAGDSRTDWELLQAAQHALLIDRGNAELKAQALEAGMSVVEQSSLR